MAMARVKSCSSKLLLLIKQSWVRPSNKWQDNKRSEEKVNTQKNKRKVCFGQNFDYSHQSQPLQSINCTVIVDAAVLLCAVEVRIKASLMGATKKPLDTYWGLKACVTCKTAPFMRKVQMQ